MEVVIEDVLVINFLLDYFALSLTSRAFGQKTPRLAYLSALLGAVVALVSPLLQLSNALKMVLALVVAVALCMITFAVKPVKKFAQKVALFYLFTLLFGGIVEVLEQNFTLNIPLILLACVGGYLLTYALLKVLARQKKMRSFIYPVVIELGGRRVQEDAFFDSGNLLCDPVTNKPVVLINFCVFQKLVQGADYLAAALQKVDTKTLREGHYVTLSTVTASAKILVFRPDKFCVLRLEDEAEKQVLLGLSLSPFCKGVGANILLNGCM